MLAEGAERFRDADSMVAVSYTGISAEDATSLRRELRGKKVRLRVLKNRIMRRAMRELGRGGFAERLEGPVAVVTADDPVAASKAAVGLARGHRLEVKGGWVAGHGPGGRDLSPEEIRRLSTLPSREALLAGIARAAASPLRSLVQLLASTGGGLARALKAWNDKRPPGASPRGLRTPLPVGVGGEAPSPDHG
jgi:large subunit ribosomal protein L10